ncbi:hypothetical protein ABID23_000658 [Bartonella silvatica]|uniref:Uncharacterized protein n=1 Tax=Bartonella silvatica TaxID=357760 RepID=A0ABV2HGA0_9HYPH
MQSQLYHDCCLETCFIKALSSIYCWHILRFMALFLPKRGRVFVIAYQSIFQINAIACFMKNI